LYTIHDEGVPLFGGVKDELRLYVPPCKQTTDPAIVAAAAPLRVLGAAAVVPELLSLPEDEAKSVQSDAKPVLATVTVIEVMDVNPATSLTFAAIV
jgi:hypothetical protein